MANSTTSFIFAPAKENADAWILVVPLSLSVKGFQVERKLAEMGRLEVSSLKLEGDKALQVAMVEEQVQLEILCSYLKSDLLSDESDAIAKFEKKLPKMADEGRLEVRFGVALGQVKKI